MSQTLQVMEELENIQQVLISYPEGASIEDIEREMTLHLPRRTLQRRLEMLQQRNIIRAEGRTKNARYYVLFSEDNLFQITSESLIPLSADGLKIQKLVSLPVQKRKPIGYNRQFLESYHSNITSYLTKNDKEKLARMGSITPPPQQAGTYSKDLLSRLLVDLSWNSSRLEGNTYSLLDTQRLIAFGETADGKSTSEAQMILNHKDAIEFLTQSSPDIGFNRYTILNLHAILSNNLLPDPQAVGRLRQSGVGIAHSVFTPLAVPQMISEIFDFLLEKTSLITNAYEQSFFMMVHLPYLQPFDDVNKRVSRLAANIPLIQNGLSPLSFVDVTDTIYIQGMLGVYELNRWELLKDVYMWAYERSANRYTALRQEMGEPDPLRMKYRQEIHHLVSSIIQKKMIPQEASHFIESIAIKLPQIDQARFVEMVSSELLSLHEGNFARYRVTPLQFKDWQKQWAVNSARKVHHMAE